MTPVEVTLTELSGSGSADTLLLAATDMAHSANTAPALS